MTNMSEENVDQEIDDPRKVAAQESGDPGNAGLPTGNSGKTTFLSGNAREVATEKMCGLGGSRGWHSRGYLPHFDARELIQHVTFHLADSLPKDVLQRFDEELRLVPAAKRNAARRTKIEAWIDAGHGSCILREPTVGWMVQESLLFFDAQRYRLMAWVVMPNHVHVLFEPIDGWSVAQVVASWKKFTARKICDYSKAANREIGEPGNAGLPTGNSGNAVSPSSGKPQPVWHREYWDRFIRDDLHFQQTVDYIHQNPVKAGFVTSAELWRWSSACWTANREIGDPPGTPVS